MARSFRRITANAREKQTTTIGNFGGVDLSSPTLQVNTARAVDVLNFIKKDGLNQKRDGFQNILNTAERIHGIWEYVDKFGAQRLVAHIGTFLYEMNGFHNSGNYTNVSIGEGITDGDNQFPIPIDIFLSNIANAHSSAFVAGGNLYVLDGTRYVVVTNRDVSIGNSNLVGYYLEDNLNKTYIPLTTTSIAPVGSLIEGQTQAYDDVNMLTQWKKNRLITDAFDTITSNPYHSSAYTLYNLDSRVYSKNPSDLSHCKLSISYLKTNASNLLNLLYPSEDFVNEIKTNSGIISDLSFDGFTFKQVAYRSSNPGRDFSINDIALRLRYLSIPLSGGTSEFIVGNYMKTNNTLATHKIVTNTADPAVYTPSAVTTYKYVVDFRPAISAGHLTLPTATNLQIQALAETNGFFEVPIKAFILAKDRNNNTTNSYLRETTIRVPVQTSSEFLSYQTKIDVVYAASGITENELVFKDGATTIAKLYYGNENKTATLEINYFNSDEYENPIPGTTNAELLYPNWTPGYSDRVAKCRFGTFFGYNGNRNRLFISGNPDFPNLTFRSSQTNWFTEKENLNGSIQDNDLTYFSDLDYNIFGTKSSSVVALEVLSNSKLLVLKTDVDSEPTIYTITGSLTDATSFDGSPVVSPDGTTALKEEIYLANVGNIGDGGVFHRATATLRGDTMFLSKTGVRSVSLAENLPVEQSRSVARSSLINVDLLKNKEYFGSAIMKTFEEFLFLCVNGKIYVCNEDYRASDKENGEYEWWVFGGYETQDEYGIKQYQPINVKDMVVIDNELYFYTEYGFFKFIKDLFLDKFTDSQGDGLLYYEPYNASLANGSPAIDYFYALEPKVLDSTHIAFKNTTYHSLGNVTWNNTTKYFTLTSILILLPEEDVINEVYEGRKVRLNSAGITTDWYMYNVTGVNFQVTTTKNNGSTLVTSMGAITFPKQMSAVVEPHTELEITLIDEDNDQFRVFVQENVTMRFTHYPSTTPNRSFYFVKNKPVTSYYITAPFNFGVNSSLKTIDRFILTNDTKIESYVEVFYLTSNTTNKFREVLGKDVNGTFDLENLTLNNIYLGSSYLPIPYSIRSNTRNISSIMFKFYNNQQTNSCLTNLTMIYYITKELR